MRWVRIAGAGLILALAVSNGCSEPPRGTKPWQHYLGCAALAGMALFVLPKGEGGSR